MIATTPRRLSEPKHLIDAWRSAARHARAGRAERAERLWQRAERTLRSLGLPASHGISTGLTVGRRLSVGPPTVPLSHPTPRRSARTLPFITRYGSIRLERRKIEGIGRSGCFDLLVDTTRRRVTVRGREVPLEGCDVLLNIVSTLVRAGGPVPFEELFPKAWGRRYNPAYDAATVYFNINRLRRLIGEASPELPFLVACRQAYRMAQGLRCAVIGESEGPRPSRGDQPGLVAYLTEHAFIDNRKYCELTGVSPSTALRELSRLSQESVLAREGAGRGVRYRLSRPTP
jgi:hypothetical protein